MRRPSFPVELWHGASSADVVAELMVGQVDLLVAGLVIAGRRRRRLLPRVVPSYDHSWRRRRRRLRDDLLDSGGGVRGAVKGLSGIGSVGVSIHVSAAHFIS